MPRIMSLQALQQLRDEVRSEIDLREKGDDIDQMIVIQVAMGTCGIAAGAREIMQYFSDEIRQRKLERVMVIQCDCMGYCKIEPTIKVEVPNKEPVLFGHVTKEKAQEILEKFIVGGEVVEGILPAMQESLKQ